MNDIRRRALAKVKKDMSSARAYLEDRQSTVSDIMTEEDDARDNMPEGLIGSEKYEKSENASEKLQECIDSLDEVLSMLDDIMDALDEAME